MTITLDALKDCKLRHGAHLDGSGWFGDIHQCIEHPRLSRMVRYIKKDRSHEVTWRVDGNAVGGQLSDAIEALNKPPILTLIEQEVLSRVPAEFVDLRKTEDWRTLHALRDKGMIEFEAGKCRKRVQA